jgi:hypothetical protein
MNVPSNAVFVLTESGAQTTPEWRAKAAASIDHCLTHSFRAAWGGSFRCVPQEDTTTPGPRVPVPLEATSDVQGAAGYHDDGGIHVFRDGVSDEELSVIADHEIKEAAIDPGANRWADTGNGGEVALEMCDAVEGFSFVPPGCEMPVSDFVLPSFFDPSGARPYSHLDKPTGPMITAADSGANYQIVRRVDENGAQQVTAILEFHPRKAAKAHPSSRTSRRGVVAAARHTTDPAPASAA